MESLSSWFSSWWFVVFPLGIAGLLGGAWWLEKRRRESFQSLALAHGMTYEDGDSWWSLHVDFAGPWARSSEPLFDRLLPGFTDRGIFERGHSRALSHVVSGDVGDLGLKMFDYRYATRHRRSSLDRNEHTFGNRYQNRVHAHTVAVVRSNEIDLPEFSLRPESIVHKVGSSLGFQDIDFSAFPKFSRQYLLRGSDEERIREVFTPAVLNWFERHPFLQAEGGGKQLVIYSRSKTPVSKLGDLLRDAVEMARAFARSAVPRSASG